MPGPKITAEIMPLVLKLNGDGKTVGEIQAFLRKNFSIQISEAAIYKRLSAIRTERGQMIQSALVNKLVNTVTCDLDAVAALLTRAHEDEITARTGAGVHEVGTEEWTRAMNVAGRCRNDLLAAVSLRLKLAGATKVDKNGQGGLMVMPEIEGDDEEADPLTPPPLPEDSPPVH